jgi:hypothetical protein
MSIRDRVTAAAVLAAGLFLVVASPARAQNASPADVPPSSYLQPSDPAYPTDGESGNLGGVHMDFVFRDMTDYVYRGIDFSDTGGKEDAPTFQFDTVVSFDLGRAPHPYIGVFANVFNADPVSRFQEIRPSAGAEWTVRPLTIDGGINSYIYPEREEQNTAELFIEFQLDDSYWTKAVTPIFSPYLYSAYDMDRYNGWYFELGVEHEFKLEETGLGLRVFADAAYVTTYQLYAVEEGGYDSGFQHYDVGLTVSYDLNEGLRLPPRYGSWLIEGYLVYTDNISNDLLAETQLWGGAGLRFKY